MVEHKKKIFVNAIGSLMFLPLCWTINVKAATVGVMQSVSSCADGHFEKFDHSAEDVEDVTGFGTALLFSPTFCTCVTMQDQIGR